MNYSVGRLEQLEARFERMRLDLADVQSQLAQALQQIRQQGSNGNNKGGASGMVYTIAPQVISAGSYATGVTVNALVAGASQALPGSYKVYNQMAVPTVATGGKTIIVGANPDGTFTAITQSC